MHTEFYIVVVDERILCAEPVYGDPVCNAVFEDTLEFFLLDSELGRELCVSESYYRDNGIRAA